MQFVVKCFSHFCQAIDHGDYSQSQRWNQNFQDMSVTFSNHGPSLKMSNCNAFEPEGNNSQPSHMRIPCSEKDVNFFGEQSHNIQILWKK
jgi:hypothetical protein